MNTQKLKLAISEFTKKKNPMLHITKRTGQNVKSAKNIISHSLRTSLLL